MAPIKSKNMALVFFTNSCLKMKMNKFIATTSLVLLTFLVSITQVHAQQSSGRIGFSLNVQADGFFNPKVIKITVNQVEPGSQAQLAGLTIGDELIQVQDVEVPGAEASVLKPHIEFVKGKPKKLVFKRVNGQIYEATLVKS
jgi:C-terminal processing protease CtpA/Prc